MATFPRPLCELRAYWAGHGTRRSQPGDGLAQILVAKRAGLSPAASERLQFRSMARGLRVRRGILARLLLEARREPAIECCGFLAGTGGAITEVLPARNLLASATAYEIAPEELFGLFRRMRERGLDHLGIYHSHPSTDNFPSPVDIERAYYPDAAYFILSPRPDAVRPVRAFTIRGGAVSELGVHEV
jgi:[CysO sulfur-carrier protein]-S-L-cysteine hydrolase